MCRTTAKISLHQMQNESWSQHLHHHHSRSRYLLLLNEKLPKPLAASSGSYVARRRGQLRFLQLQSICPKKGILTASGFLKGCLSLRKSARSAVLYAYLYATSLNILMEPPISCME